MTFYDKLEGDARKAYEDSIGVIWAEAQRQLSLDEQALVLRDLLASEDMTLATESWLMPIPTTVGFNSWINTTIDDTRFVAIYGFAAVSAGHSGNITAGGAVDAANSALRWPSSNLAHVTLLRVTRGGKQLRIWQVQPFTANVGIHASDDAGGGAQNGAYNFYADDPVTVFQNIPIKVEFFSTASGAWQGATPVLPLLGKVAEPEGKTINR